MRARDSIVLRAAAGGVMFVLAAGCHPTTNRLSLDNSSNGQHIVVGLG